MARCRPSWLYTQRAESNSTTCFFTDVQAVSRAGIEKINANEPRYWQKIYHSY